MAWWYWHAIRTAVQLIISILVAYLFEKFLWQRYLKSIEHLNRRKTNDKQWCQDPLVYPENPDKITQHQWIYLRMERMIAKLSSDIVVGNRFRILRANIAKSVFLDYDLLKWILNYTDVLCESEAQHLANLLLSYGYILPVYDRFMPIQKNKSFYRFQEPKFYPSNNFKPKDEEYAVHLCVRVMNSSKLDNYEEENFSRLKEKFSDHWEEISRCAEYRTEAFKKMNSTDSKLYQFRERGFWNVHRPKPGIILTTEIDYKKSKAYRIQTATANDPNDETNTRRESCSEPLKLERRNVNQSQPGNNHVPYCIQYADYDPFITQSMFYNYWLINKIGEWKKDHNPVVTKLRTNRWKFSLRDLLTDSAGKEHFKMFLEKEFSYENLKFWDAVMEFKKLPLSQLEQTAQEIWTEYIESDGINIDSHSREVTKQNMTNPDRYTFDIAAKHVYHLMETDSYRRYLQSKMYNDKVEESVVESGVTFRDIYQFYRSKLG